MKRLLALALCACLMLGTATAAGLDGALSGYLDGNSDVRYAMSAQIETLTPFGEGTIAMLNGVLKHMSVTADIREDETVMEIGVSGDTVMALTERATDAGTELTTPLLPNRALQSRDSALGKLGLEGEEKPFDLFSAISELEGCYQALTDAILPYAEQKKANYNIKNVGSSKWSRIARLTEEQGVELSPLIEAVLGCGMDEAYRENLKGLTTSKGFIVGLYQTKEGGDDLAVYMKGYVTLADGITRQLAYQWAFSVKDGVRIDTLKYELVRSKKAASTREIHAEIKRRADTELVFKGECELTVKDGDLNVTYEDAYNLSGKEKDGVRTITGEASLITKNRVDEKTTTQTLTLTPDMKLTSSEGSGVLSGSVKVEQKTGKVVHTALTILFDEEPAQLLQEAAQNGVLFSVTEPDAPQSSLTQNAQEKPGDYLVGEPPIGLTRYDAPQTMQVIDLDTADLAPLMEELAQNLAGKLLIALSKIPEEDAALLRDNLSEADYEAFLKMAEGL